MGVRDLDSSLPIVAHGAAGNLRVLGTAFPILKRFLLTAGHCLPERDGDRFILQEANELQILEYEKLPCDLGIIHVDAWSNDAIIRPWCSDYPLLASEVVATGFSELVVDSLMFARTFRTYVSTRHHDSRVPEAESVLELQIPLPTGMSGCPIELVAPIREVDGKRPSLFPVVGVFVGNASSSFEIRRTVETTQLDGRTVETTIILEQAHHYAIVVPAAEILALESRILGASVAQAIQREGTDVMPWGKGSS